MKDSDFSNYVEQHLALLPTDSMLTDPIEAGRRACVFLKAVASLAMYEEAVSNDLVKNKSVRDTMFAEKLNAALGKDAKARESNAKADPDYIMAREELERTENRTKTVQTLEKVFDNAQVIFRQVANRGVPGDSNGGRS